MHVTVHGSCDDEMVACLGSALRRASNQRLTDLSVLDTEGIQQPDLSIYS